VDAKTDAGAADHPDLADRPDAPDSKDAPSVEVGPTCPTESEHDAPSPSATCNVVPAPGAATCPSAGECPVSGVFTLSCTGGGYGPALAATAGGTSIMFVTNTGKFVTRLFTLAPDAGRVEDVPGVTSAANALAADLDGNPTIFAGEMPGIWRVRKTAAGWRREVALETGGPLALVTDGRARDATKAAVAFFRLGAEAPALATRDGACWRVDVLPGARATHLGLDVDATNRPWVAWYAYLNGRAPALELVGPDGPHRVWTSPVNEGLALQDRPIVLANGLAGTDASPALAIQRGDGVHLLVPAPAAAAWSDRVLTGSAAAVRANNCPTGTPFGCNGQATCTSTVKGALGGFGLTRTASGRAYAAWLEGDGGATYSLSLSSTTGGFCPGGPAAAPVQGGANAAAPPLCQCTPTMTSWHGTVTIAVERVDAPAAGGPLRIQIDAGAEPRKNGLALAARGNTLLVVASFGAGFDTKLRYLEIDTKKLH
jgi:hypothetical protein